MYIYVYTHTLCNFPIPLSMRTLHCARGKISMAYKTLLKGQGMRLTAYIHLHVHNIVHGHVFSLLCKCYFLNFKCLVHILGSGVQLIYYKPILQWATDLPNT